jgi:hypothetical protein
MAPARNPLFLSVVCEENFKNKKSHFIQREHCTSKAKKKKILQKTLIVANTKIDINHTSTGSGELSTIGASFGLGESSPKSNKGLLESCGAAAGFPSSFTAIGVPV